MKQSKKNIRKLQEKANDLFVTIEFVTSMCDSKNFTKEDIISSFKDLIMSDEFVTNKEKHVLKFVYAPKESALSYLHLEIKEEFLKKFNEFVDKKNGYLECVSKIKEIYNILPYVQYGWVFRINVFF